MSTIRVNGAEREVQDGATLAGLLGELGLPGDGRGCAVALDGAVVPRGRWPVTVLHAGARVEVLVAVQGG